MSTSKLYYQVVHASSVLYFFMIRCGCTDVCVCVCVRGCVFIVEYICVCVFVWFYKLVNIVIRVLVFVSYIHQFYCMGLLGGWCVRARTGMEKNVLLCVLVVACHFCVCARVSANFQFCTRCAHDLTSLRSSVVCVCYSVFVSILYMNILYALSIVITVSIIFGSLLVAAFIKTK